MKRLGLALAAFAALAIGAAPLAAHAQDTGPQVTKQTRAQGMKEGPAAIQAAGVPCTVTDAYFLGDSDQKDAAGKAFKAKLYEVACKEGLGYVVIVGGEKNKAYDCLAMAGQKALSCKLPANADPKQGLGVMVAAAGHACAPKDARYAGSNETVSIYEVACQDGSGFVLERPVAAGAPKVLPCVQTLGQGALECQLTSKQAIVASLAKIAAQTGKACQVSDARFVGLEAKTSNPIYEVGCGPAAGFMMEADNAGKLVQVIGCGSAHGLGGCKMTDTTKVETSEAQTYTQLAKAGGLNCNVSKYRPIGLDEARNEVVELACSNRAEGVVAVFPSQSNGKTRFVDCIRGGQFGPSGACKLTDASPLYARYTQALAAKGRTSCKVSGAGYLGRTSGGTDYIETACADGAPGYVMEMNQANSIVTLLSCGQAGSVGVACKLASNLKH